MQVLGMCFLFGGMKYPEQSFSSTVASTMSSLMAVASASLIIPAALYATLTPTDKSSQHIILQLSRGTAVVLLVLYVLYLFFQLKTHAHLFLSAEETEQEEKQLSVLEAAAVLVMVTILVSVCAEYLVGSIDSTVKNSGISKTFVGLILLPIVGNAAEVYCLCRPIQTILTIN